MYLKLHQNEVLNIPVNGVFWLPLVKKGDYQIIWRSANTGLNNVNYTIPTHIINGEEVNTDYQDKLNEACLQYLSSTDWYVTRQAETGVAIPADILTKRQTCRENIL